MPPRLTPIAPQRLYTQVWVRGGSLCYALDHPMEGAALSEMFRGEAPLGYAPPEDATVRVGTMLAKKCRILDGSDVLVKPGAIAYRMAAAVVLRVPSPMAANRRYTVALADGTVCSIRERDMKDKTFLTDTRPAAGLFVEHEAGLAGGPAAVATNAAASPSEDAVECPVCLEAYNDHGRRRVTCFACKKSVCRACAGQSIVTNTDQAPQCIHCKCELTRAFIYENLGRTFVEGRLRRHRKHLLLQSEEARVPETMALVPSYREMLRTKSEWKRRPTVATRRAMQQANTEYWRQRHDQFGGEGNRSARERVQFTRRCPKEGCRGFLDRSWHCPVCDELTCRHCHEFVGDARAMREHTCDPQTRLSAEAIEKETRNCPSCAVAIYKISGCDQMWCTQCHIAFSWRTGRRVHGRVHNPHFFEWQRNQAPEEQAIPRQVDVGGVPPTYVITTCLRSAIFNMNQARSSTSTRSKNVAALYINHFRTTFESFIHLTYHDIENLRISIAQASNHTDARLKYLVGETTRKQFTTLLLRRNNRLSVRREELHVLELVSTVVTGMLQSVAQSPRNTIHELVCCTQKIQQILRFANERFDEISRLYGGCEIYMFPETRREFSLKWGEELSLRVRRRPRGG